MSINIKRVFEGEEGAWYFFDDGSPHLFGSRDRLGIERGIVSCQLLLLLVGFLLLFICFVFPLLFLQPTRYVFLRILKK